MAEPVFLRNWATSGLLGPFETTEGAMNEAIHRGWTSATIVDSSNYIIEEI